MPDPRFDDPALFRSHLNETTIDHLSRFAYPRVSASPEDLRIQFSILGSINVLVALSCGLLILSILRSNKLRNTPFNLYLLSVAIPDVLSGLSCMLTCPLSVRQATYYSEAMCGYQSFFLNASVTANTWMNAVIVYQIHKLLRYSKKRLRFQPPTRKQVRGQAAIVYCYAILWGAICATQRDLFGMPFQCHAYAGFYCIPMEEQGN